VPITASAAMKVRMRASLMRSTLLRWRCMTTRFQSR
jgi:hypothetical protein